jgi:hypothetical protein
MRHRTGLIAVLFGLATAVTFHFWSGFLNADRCLDAGGRMANGACEGALHVTSMTFSGAPWQFKLFLLLPAFACGAVLAWFVMFILKLLRKLYEVATRDR